MSWIVLGEKNGLINLRSINSEEEEDGLLPIGSFLTINTSKKRKIIIQVTESRQSDPFAPTALLAEMNLKGLTQDTKCYNILKAIRIYHKSDRDDGKFDFIKARTMAERSSNDDIRQALGGSEDGPSIFPATIFSGGNSLIKGGDNNYLHVKLDQEMFWHGMAIIGSMGMGKTVALKYLSRYFVEELGGCVIALNVKNDDLLHMEKPTQTNTKQFIKEWEAIGINNNSGIDNFHIYQPFGERYQAYANVDQNRIHPISLSVSNIEPEALLGLLRDQMRDLGTRWFPDIFRWWKTDNPHGSFSEFCDWFDDEDLHQGGIYNTLDVNNNDSTTRLWPQTIMNMSLAIKGAVRFFDTEGTQTIDASLLLERGKFSTIDLVGAEDGIHFGSVFIRHIMSDLIKRKQREYPDLKVLIIIDEVHKFHSAEKSTKAALAYLDDIARTGRGSKVGIIFASQDLSTLPKGIASIVNTTVSFSTPDKPTASKFGISSEHLVSLDKGYAVGMFHNVRNLKFVKFPLSTAGA